VLSVLRRVPIAAISNDVVTTPPVAMRSVSMLPRRSWWTTPSRTVDHRRAARRPGTNQTIIGGYDQRTTAAPVLHGCRSDPPTSSFATLVIRTITQRNGELLMSRSRPELAARRKARGFTQESLAYALGVDRSTVARWECAATEPQPWLRPKLARALGVSTDDLASLLTGDHDERRVSRGVRADPPDVDERDNRGEAGWVPAIAGPEWGPKHSAELAALLEAGADVPVSAETVTRLTHQWLVTEPPQIREVTAGRRIGADLVEKVERRVAQLRRMDDFVAGCDLRELVERELCSLSDLFRAASYSCGIGRRMLVVIGELCQLAGWVTADAGDHRRAARYYTLGVTAAHAAGERPLAANLISTLAYHLSNTGDRKDAVLLAQTAVAGARHSATVTSRALFGERLAWTHARVGDRRSTERALAAVERNFEQRRPADDPEWVYWLTEDEVTVMAGRCFVELGLPATAIPLLTDALARYDERMTREVALYTSWLAEAHLAAGEVDQAAVLATRTFVLTGRTSSTRTDDRVRLLSRRLEPFAAVPLVRQFVEQVREEGGAR
jgi:transcriptional regulator with XRE-family HTH domain